MVKVTFINYVGEYERTLGPFPYVQARYGELIAGPDDKEISVFSNLYWVTRDTKQQFTDIAISSWEE